MDRRYDVLVVGSGVGGICAASLLSKRGLSVLFLEQEKTGYDYRHNGHKFKMGASLFTGLERGGLFDSILSEIGVGLPLLKKEDKIFHRACPFIQVVLHENRINLSENLDELSAELKREFCCSADNIDSIFTTAKTVEQKVRPFLKDKQSRKKRFASVKQRLDYIESYLFFLGNFVKYSNQKAIRFLEMYTKDQNLIVFFDLVSQVYYGRGVRDISSLLLFEMFSLFENRLVGFCSGGHQVLYKIFKETALKNGCDIVPVSGFSDITCKQGRVVSVELADGESICANDFVFNIPVRKKETDEILVYFFLTTPNECIPCQMHENLMVQLDLGLDDKGPCGMWLNLSYDDSECRNTPAGERGITASILLEKGFFEKKGISFFRDRILERLCLLMPFVSGNLTCMGEKLIDFADFQGEHVCSGAAYTKMINGIKFKGDNAALPYANAHIIPECFDATISLGQEVKDGLKIVNLLKEPKFSFASPVVK